jgi:hypothetical protein
LPGLTIPHLVDLGADAATFGRRLDGAAAWDALRTGTSGPFALPADREAWERAADEQPQMRERMAAVATEISSLGVSEVTSYGVGTAMPEVWLRRVAPELRLTLTEVAEGNLARLREAFPELAIAGHDLTRDPPAGAGAALFHRIDTEFGNRTWRRVFRRFADRPVVVVATDVLSPERARIEIRQLPYRWRARWQRAGWSRTAGAFESLWRATHEGERRRFGDLEGWVLRPRRG